MKSRTKARSVALQVLFEMDLTSHQPNIILEDRLVEIDLEPGLVEFTRQIIDGVAPLVEQLDHHIARFAPEWPLDQVAVIDRNILRIAVWEFAIAECTPVKVAINEAIELAKLYGSDSTPRFVNGVLGSLASRQSDIRQSFGLT